MWNDHWEDVKTYKNKQVYAGAAKEEMTPFTKLATWGGIPEAADMAIEPPGVMGKVPMRGEAPITGPPIRGVAPITGPPIRGVAPMIGITPGVAIVSNLLLIRDNTAGGMPGGAAGTAGTPKAGAIAGAGAIGAVKKKDILNKFISLKKSLKVNNKMFKKTRSFLLKYKVEMKISCLKLKFILSKKNFL